MSQKKGLFSDHPLCLCVWNSSLKGENLAERLYISTFQLSHMFECCVLPPETWTRSSLWQSHACVQGFCSDCQDSWTQYVRGAGLLGTWIKNTHISVLSVSPSPLTQNVLSVRDKQSWLSILWSGYVCGLILIWFLIKAQFILKNNIWIGWMDYRMLQRHLVSLFYFLIKEEQKHSGFCIC